MSTPVRITTSLPVESTPTLPYPPSFVDRFMNAVTRLPLPYWLTYVVLFLVQSGVTLLWCYLAGWLVPPAVNPQILIFPMWLWAPLALMTYLDGVSLRALAEFSPLLDLPPEAVRRLKHEFTTMPLRGVVLNAVFWAVVYIFSFRFFLGPVFELHGLTDPLSLFLIVQGLAAYAFGLAIYYHSIRQLRLVHRTVSAVKHFRLFHLDPIYAFSHLTARTGIAWIVLLTITVLLVPFEISFGPMLYIQLIELAIALAAFALPLRVVNQRLVAEKHRLLSELDARLDGLLERLNESLDADRLADVGPLNTAISGLTAERDIILKIPTWPWRPGLLTGFLTIAVLPLVFPLVQLAIQRLLP